MQALTPVAAYVLATLLRIENVSVARVAGLIIATIGALLFVSGSTPTDDSDVEARAGPVYHGTWERYRFAIGVCCFIIQDFSYAGSLLLHRPLVSKPEKASIKEGKQTKVLIEQVGNNGFQQRRFYGPLCLTAWGYLVGTTFTFAIALMNGDFQRIYAKAASAYPGTVPAKSKLPLTSESLWALTYCVLFVSVFNYCTYSYANARLSSVTVSLFMVIQPAATLLLTVFVDGADISALHVIGISAILCGLKIHLAVP